LALPRRAQARVEGVTARGAIVLLLRPEFVAEVLISAPPGSPLSTDCGPSTVPATAKRGKHGISPSRSVWISRIAWREPSPVRRCYHSEHLFQTAHHITRRRFAGRDLGGASARLTRRLSAASPLKYRLKRADRIQAARPVPPRVRTWRYRGAECPLRQEREVLTTHRRAVRAPLAS